MSLFRTTLIAGAVIALLPTDKGKQQQLYAQVAALGQDALTYCDRNAETCAKAGEAWETFKVKAAFAAELVVEAVQKYSQGPDAHGRGDGIATGGEARAAPVSHSSGTLTERDIAPAWRGPKGQQRL